MDLNFKAILTPKGEANVGYCVFAEENKEVLLEIATLARDIQFHLKQARGTLLLAERKVDLRKLTIRSESGFSSVFVFGEISIDAHHARGPIVTLSSVNVNLPATLCLRQLMPSEIELLCAQPDSKVSETIQPSTIEAVDKCAY